MLCPGRLRWDIRNNFYRRVAMHWHRLPRKVVAIIPGGAQGKEHAVWLLGVWEKRNQRKLRWQK